MEISKRFFFFLQCHSFRKCTYPYNDDNSNHNIITYSHDNNNKSLYIVCSVGE